MSRDLGMHIITYCYMYIMLLNVQKNADFEYSWYMQLKVNYGKPEAETEARSNDPMVKGTYHNLQLHVRFFFQEGDTPSRKIVWNHHIVHQIAQQMAIQCKQAPYTPILITLDKVVTSMCAHGPTHQVACGRKTLQMHGFPMQTYGSFKRAITLILRCESKFLKVKSIVSTHSGCPCKNYTPKVLPNINYFSTSQCVRCCYKENKVFLICLKFEGWGGPGRAQDLQH